MKMSWIALALVASLASLPLASQTKRCLTDDERAAMHVRLLQTELMVGAISCRNETPEIMDRYNAFVRTHGESIGREGKVLQNYFLDAYGRESNTRFDRFTTALANETSTRSMNDQAFCRKSMVLAEQSGKVAKGQLASYAGNWVTANNRKYTACGP
jgi:hypothetical protein